MSYKNIIEKNIQTSHEASKSSRYMQSGLTDKRAKLSSKNFDKLMLERGLSKEEIVNLKASNQPGSMEVRHAKVGEKFVTTHGMERSSGVFVSEKSLGNTPGERIDKGALPHSNSAEYETIVELSKDQNLVYGEIAPQSKFSKMDPAQAPRSGGVEQVITDGGYSSGAVINRDPKYPIPASLDFKKRAQVYKDGYKIETSVGGENKGYNNKKAKSSTVKLDSITVEEYKNAQKQEDEGFREKSEYKENTENRYKKEGIEKENSKNKKEVENQEKDERREGREEDKAEEFMETEDKSEKKDKLENREDEKDYEEEGAENKDKTETLSEDELEEERWNEPESEDEAELLSDKAEVGEEQNTEDKAVTETESELQDNAADLSSEESSGETEDNSETEDNVEDLSSEESSEETEDESEEEDEAEDLSSEESTEETEDESEEEDKAEDLSSEESSGEIEDNSEEEDKAEDLSSEESSGETEDNSEEEDRAEDLSSGKDDSTSYDSGGSEEDENYSY